MSTDDLAAAFLAILRPSWADRHRYASAEDQARACCALAEKHAEHTEALAGLARSWRDEAVALASHAGDAMISCAGQLEQALAGGGPD